MNGIETLVAGFLIIILGASIFLAVEAVLRLLKRKQRQRDLVRLRTMAEEDWEQLARFHTEQSIDLDQLKKFVESEYKGHFDKALVSLANKDFSETLREVEFLKSEIENETQSIRKNKTKALLIEARALDRLNKFHEEKDVLEEALKVDPNNKDVMREYALALVKQGQGAKASDFLRDQLKRNPSPETLTLLLRILPVDSSKRETQRLLRKYTEAFDFNAQQLVVLSEAYVEAYENGLERALPYIRKSVRLNADNSVATHLLGNYYYKKKNYKLAEQYFRAAKDNLPQRPVGLCICCHAPYHSREDTQKDAFSDHVTIDFAAALVKNEKFQEAIEVLTELTQYPEHEEQSNCRTNALLILAESFVRLKRFDEAKKILDRVKKRELRPSNLYDIGCVHALMNDDAAINFVAEAFAKDPKLKGWAMKDPDLKQLREQISKL